MFAHDLNSKNGASQFLMILAVEPLNMTHPFVFFFLAAFTTRMLQLAVTNNKTKTQSPPALLNTNHLNGNWVDIVRDNSPVLADEFN